MYQDQADLDRILDLLSQSRSLTDDWRYAHIGEFLLSFFFIARHLDPTHHIRLWFDRGRLIAYSILGEDPFIDFQVHPDYAWQGIEAQALAWASRRIEDLRRHAPEQWKGQWVSGARQDDYRRRSFLEAHGFEPGGAFSEVNMMRSLDGPIPEAWLPEGCTVVGMDSAADAADRAGAQRDVWSPWTVGNVSEVDYSYLMQLPGYYPDLDVVAVAPDGVIAAYVNGWIDPLNKIGDFGPVGARTAYRRRGFTRAALLECMRRMQAYGMNRVCVSTGVSNTPAVRLYESVGFRTVNQYLEYVRQAPA